MSKLRVDVRILIMGILAAVSLQGLADHHTRQSLVSAQDCEIAFVDSAPSLADCNECKAYLRIYASPELLQPLVLELDQRCPQIAKVAPFEERYDTGWSIYTDQDVLALDQWLHNNEDRNYTMGLGFARSGARHSTGFLARGRNWLDKRLNLHNKSLHVVEHHHAVEYGVTAFTPGDLEDSQPIAGDRPYASLLYYANSKLSAFANASARKSKLVLAMLGLPIAGEVQEILHNEAKFSSSDPSGWHNQISYGGELTALYNFSIMHNYRPSSKVDLAGIYETNIGYYTDIAAGFDMRIGRVRSPYYAHNANPLSSYNHLASGSSLVNDFYGFVSYRMRGVGYNVLLQGQFRENKTAFKSDEIERLIHEVSTGFTYTYNKRFHMTYALNYRSPEFKGNESREHWYGGLYLTRTFAD